MREYLAKIKVWLHKQYMEYKELSQHPLGEDNQFIAGYAEGLKAALKYVTEVLNYYDKVH